MTDFNVVLFDDFETLDVFGPVEIIGKLEKQYKIEYFSEKGGMVRSSQNARIETMPMREIEEAGVLLIPGGFGTRREVDNPEFIEALRDISLNSCFVLTVCTGSALLAKTGLLKHVRATSNKLAFDWAVRQDEDVQWIKKARWVSDGKYYTSSGVSAGIDMTLGFVNDTMRKEAAEKISRGIEYVWNKYKDNDPFCEIKR